MSQEYFYIKLYVSLLSAIDRYGNDSAEADKIREEMDEPWYKMTEDEQEEMRSVVERFLVSTPNSPNPYYKMWESTESSLSEVRAEFGMDKEDESIESMSKQLAVDIGKQDMWQKCVEITDTYYL